MIGLIPRNHFEQPGNLIPLGKHLLTGFLNLVPKEWQVYAIGPKKNRIFSYVSYYMSVTF